MSPATGHGLLARGGLWVLWRAAVDHMPSDGAGLLPTFYAVLEPPRTTAPAGQRRRVVLLHGWNQNHRIWLRTAAILRDKYNLEVLLLDFYNHGESPTLRDRSAHTAETLRDQVRAVILHVGWSEDKLVFGGCSLGGGVALLYLLLWPENVDRLVLIATVGFDEPFWAPSTISGKCAGAILGKPPLPPEGQPALPRAADGTLGSLADAPSVTPWGYVYARLMFIRNTPRFRVPLDIIQRLKELQTPVAVFAGGLDILHSAHLDLWNQLPGVRIFHYPWRDHTVMCSTIWSLRLWQFPEIWGVPQQAVAEKTALSKL